MRSLGGQTVELDFGQRQMLTAIQNDSQWMDERIEARKEAVRKRVAEFRKKQDNPAKASANKADSTFPPRLAATKKDDADESCNAHKDDVRNVTRSAQCNGYMPDVTHVTNVTHCNQCNAPSIHPTIQPSIQPSILPSIQPSIHPAVCVSNIKNAPAPAHARRGVPTLETVLAACVVMGVPDWYARWWYAEMTARDWTKVDGSPIGNHNWRPVMKSWWNRDEKDDAHLNEIRERHEVKPVVKVVYTAEDWLLCAERGAHCTKDGCGKGIAVPPARSEQPYPPEECKQFKKIG